MKEDNLIGVEVVAHSVPGGVGGQAGKAERNIKIV